MKGLKKLTATILASAIILCAAPLTEFVDFKHSDPGGLEKIQLFVSDFLDGFVPKAEAAIQYIDGYYTYKVENGSAEITDVDVSISGDITIPSTLGGYTVTCIGYKAFCDCSALTSITIPDSVTGIEKRAFYNCYNLSSVTIGNSVESIGFGAFENCESLVNITIPESVTSIGKWAFSRCLSLTSITIPDSVASIGYKAFCYCDSLTSVKIPAGVTSFGKYAFAYCTDLTSITVDDANALLSNDEHGVLFNKDKTILIQYPIGNSRTSYEIPDGVINIRGAAFAFCQSLTSITIPDSVITIEESAFDYCKGLTSITIPDSVTSIGDSALSRCTGITSISIPDSVKSIGDYAFNSCNNLTSVSIGNGLTSIGDWSFSFCESLKSIKIPDSVTSIGGFAFRNCNSLTRAEISDSMTSIKYGTFAYCDNLVSVTIPDSVTSIGDSAFLDCNSLSDVYYTGTEEEWDEISIFSTNTCLLDATIHYNCVLPCTHSYTSEITTPATCTENGIMTYICNECGDVYTEEISMLGHTEGEWEVVTKSSCIAAGEKSKKCTVCGEVLETEEIAMSEHVADEWVISIEPSCTSEGEKVANCTICGATVASDVVPAKGHTAGEWETVLEPTTEAEGKKAKKCTKCGEILETATIAKLPKEPVKDSAVVVNPSKSTIGYGDSIILHVDESKIPEGGYIEWTANNGNFSYSADGASCEIRPEKSGDTVFTATIYDAYGNAVSTDEQSMTAKAGIFDKIIAFFKRLFGLNKTIPNVFKF